MYYFFFNFNSGIISYTSYIVFMYSANSYYNISYELSKFYIVGYFLYFSTSCDI